MIIIKTPQPDTEERLVLVPPDACTPVFENGKQTGLSVRAQGARDATPADLLRAGYVPREVPSAEAWKAAHAEAERELIRARAALAEQPDPGTLAHLRADLRDAVKRAEKAEGLLIQRETELRLAREDGDERARDLRQAYERAVAAAEKAERERDEALGRAQSETEWRVRAVSERQDAEAERDTLRAELAEARKDREDWAAEAKDLRAELARLTLVDEEEPTVSWFYDTYCARPESTQQEDCADAYRLGVAHERARQPEKGRATDEELFGIADGIADGLRAIILAVAARVRQECLVAQAVGMGASLEIGPHSKGVDIHVSRPREDADGGEFFEGDRVESGRDDVPPAEVPATLARLLGEVSR